ncbi:histidine phosphatase superfamily [Xylaria curta]|nr:histidine phosphatase superfamily [Xylaria curta]
MPPSIYLVRHAEGEHNLEHRNWIRDATLTSKGKSQCRELKDNFPDLERISTVITSPLRRAMQTAAIAFAPAINREGVQFIAHPLAQETNAHECDIGHSRAELEGQLSEILVDRDPAFPVTKLDLSLVEDGWASKAGKYATDKPIVEARAAELRSWLFQRPEARIVCVTHGAFLHYLTEDWTGDDPERGTGWLNCEVRVFEFTENSTESDAHLFEDKDAKADHVMPTTKCLKTMY